MPVAESEDKEPHRFWRWYFHRPVQVVVLITLANLLGSLSAYVLDNAPLSVLFAIVWITLLLVYVISSYKHTQGLCHFCIDEVPLDGDAEAQKHLRLLKFDHMMHRPLTMFIPTAVILAFSLLTPKTLLYSVLGNMLWWPYIGSEWVAKSRHARLGPWCPYCRDDDGGGEEEAPKVPDPEPSGEKVNS